MTRSQWLAALAIGLLAAAPASADKLMTIHSHTDAMTLMGHTVPARDVDQQTWFGADGIRFDNGESVIILRLDQKKFYIVNEEKKTYSTLDLPLDIKKLVPPEMAPMMEKMMGMMQIKVEVTPSSKTGSYGGSSRSTCRPRWARSPRARSASPRRSRSTTPATGSWSTARARWSPTPPG